MARLTPKQTLAVSLACCTLAANSAAVLLGWVPQSAVVGALLIFALEAAKVALVAMVNGRTDSGNDSSNNSSNNSGRTTVLLLAEGATFLLVGMVLVVLAHMAPEACTNALLIALCIDFFVARAAGSLFLSPYLWK